MTGAPAQVCVRCRNPISEGARKDRFGNAYCQSCANAMISALERVRQRGAQPAPQPVAKSSAPPPAAPLARSTPPPRPSTPASTPAPPPLAPPRLTSGPIPLADSPAPGSDAPPKPPGRRSVTPPRHIETSPIPDGIIPVEPETNAPKLRTRVCESCSKTVNADVFVCPYCHYDARLGSPAKLKAPIQACSNCGYDLAGLPDPPICPECGTQNTRITARAIQYRQESAQADRRAYRRPAIMLGIGLFGLLTMVAVEHAFGKGTLVQALLIPAKYLVEVPLGLAAYVACCFLWIGFDMPLRLVAFRLAAIYSIVDLIGAIGDAVGLFNVIIWPIAILTYIGLLMEELDLEFQDAVVLSVVSGFVKLIVGAILFAIAHYLKLI